MDPVKVAVRFLYVLRHWSLEDWPVEPLADPEKGFDGEYLEKLRVGAFTDPIKSVTVLFGTFISCCVLPLLSSMECKWYQIYLHCLYAYSSLGSLSTWYTLTGNLHY